MDDYDRTMELVEVAQNSAGASAVQFDKTLDSLSSKVNQMKTEFEAFYTKLINADLFKSAISFITKLLDTLNELHGALSLVALFFTGVFVKNLIMGAIKVGKNWSETFAQIKSNITDLDGKVVNIKVVTIQTPEGSVSQTESGIILPSNFTKKVENAPKTPKTTSITTASSDALKKISTSMGKNPEIKNAFAKSAYLGVTMGLLSGITIS